MVLEENPGARVGVGVIVSLCASLVDAIGINLLRRDHVRNAQLPPDEQRHECKRLTWHIGFYMYVGSQLFGSTGALYFLQPAVVAALGSASLVFNFLCAYWLVGTRITKMDLLATALIIIGACLVAVFGSVPKTEVSVTLLLSLYGRSQFIIYFSILCGIAMLLLVLALYLKRIAKKSNTERRRSSQTQASTVVQKSIQSLQSLSANRLRKYMGIAFAVAGGTIASITVVVAETAILLVTSKENQFTSAAPFIILILLIASAFLQVFCMNAGLKTCDPVIVVPIFFTFYSVLALFNANVYYDRWNEYTALAYAMIILGIVIIVPGVYLISASQSKRPGDEEAEEDVTDELDDDKKKEKEEAGEAANKNPEDLEKNQPDRRKSGDPTQAHPHAVMAEVPPSLGSLGRKSSSERTDVDAINEVTDPVVLTQPAPHI